MEWNGGFSDHFLPLRLATSQSALFAASWVSSHVRLLPYWDFHSEVHSKAKNSTK